MGPKESNQTKNKNIPYSTLYAHMFLYGPRHEKTCRWGFWKIEVQTSLLSFRD